MLVVQQLMSDVVITTTTTHLLSPPAVQTTGSWWGGGGGGGGTLLGNAAKLQNKERQGQKLLTSEAVTVICSHLKTSFRPVYMHIQSKWPRGI